MRALRKPAPAQNWVMGALLVVAVVAFILLLPIALPVALVQNRKRARRMMDVVRSFVCVSCGKALGLEAIRLGDGRWKAHVADLRTRFPRIRFRMVRDIDAVCPACGCEYMFRDADFTLVVRPAREGA